MSADARYLFLDMNAYFASCEQQDRPELRGRPIAVLPTLSPYGCCISPSYEARTLGVRTGMRVPECQSRCPHITFVEARPEFYVAVHHRIVTAVERCVPVEQIHSIDELSCRLLANEAARALELGETVKRSILETVGEHLCCSVGVAPNRLLAKIAAEMHKPDGLTLIRRADLPHVLHDLELTDLPGISRGISTRLARIGVYSVEQLCALPERGMEKVWGGVVGRRWWSGLRGEQVYEPPTHRRTIGHARVLPPGLRTPDEAWAILVGLASKAAMRLRRLNYWAGKLAVQTTYRDRSSWHATQPLGLVQDTPTILDALQQAWAGRPPDAPLTVGASLIDLVPPRSASLPLFQDDHARRLRLSAAMDRINETYGNDAVRLGAACQVSIPTRIAFGRIPDQMGRAWG